jgi:hypothetical protein
MKRLLLFLISAVFAGSLFAQLSTEESQILYLSFDDADELTLNWQEVEVTDEVDMEGDEGKFHGGALFNGESSYMIFEPIEGWNHGMSWSWSFWIKSEAAQDFWGIMSFGNHSGDIMADYYDEPPRVGGLILVTWDSLFSVDISWIGGVYPDEEGDPPVQWIDGEWHHIVMTYDAEAGEMVFYQDNDPSGFLPEVEFIANDLIDIVAEEPDFTEEDVTLDDDHIKIGASGPGWLPEEDEEWPDNMFFNGWMDDMRLFNVALTPEQVDEIFNYVPDNTLGLRNNEPDELFRLYPNPANDYIRIKADTRNLEVRIYSVSGQLVKSVWNENMIDVSSLPEGLYFVEGIVDGTSSVQKVVIE